MQIPAFEDMVGAIRQAVADKRLVSRTPLATVIHVELLKSLSDLDAHDNRQGVREAYACLFEYDFLNSRENGRANGAKNGNVVSLSSINVCAADRVTARTIGK
jgi:hypothetical protein